MSLYQCTIIEYLLYCIICLAERISLELGLMLLSVGRCCSLHHYPGLGSSFSKIVFQLGSPPLQAGDGPTNVLITNGV